MCQGGFVYVCRLCGWLVRGARLLPALQSAIVCMSARPSPLEYTDAITTHTQELVRRLHTDGYAFLTLPPALNTLAEHTESAVCELFRGSESGKYRATVELLNQGYGGVLGDRETYQITDAMLDLPQPPPPTTITTTTTSVSEECTHMSDTHSESGYSTDSEDDAPHSPWPDSVPDLRTAGSEFFSAVRAASEELLVAIATGLGVSRDVAAALPACLRNADSVDNSGWRFCTLLRCLLYLKSASEESEGENESVTLAAHRDTSVLTLTPCSQYPELDCEVDGVWIEGIEAHAPPGSWLLFGGHYLEHLTSGYIKALNHRVVRRVNEQRYAMPFFLRAHNRALLDSELWHQESELLQGYTDTPTPSAHVNEVVYRLYWRPGHVKAAVARQRDEAERRNSELVANARVAQERERTRREQALAQREAAERERVAVRAAVVRERVGGTH